MCAFIYGRKRRLFIPGTLISALTDDIDIQTLRRYFEEGPAYGRVCQSVCHVRDRQTDTQTHRQTDRQTRPNASPAGFAGGNNDYA